MRPAAGVVLTFSRAGRVRARATTGAEGTYRVTLAPGAYGVRVTHPSDVRRLNPATVRVVGGQSLRVTFYMDTGIR
jgi:protocatechuate 3,4-dioxygenase beta subunit